MKKNSKHYKPVAEYLNAYVKKKQIFREIKGKSGVYRWTHKKSGISYIGSSKYLHLRFLQYFNVNHLKRTHYMYICRALLKHGYSNFSFEILEYCSPEKCLEREAFYLKKFKPKYNISLNPSAPFSGRKHSNKTKQIMSDTAKKIDHPGRYKTGEENPMHGKPKPEGAGRVSQPIEVTDITNNTTTSYNSIREAARALEINESSIRRNLKSNSNKSYKNIYMFAYKK